MSLPKYEGMPHFYFCTKKCCKHSVSSSRRIKAEWVTRLRIASKTLVAQGIKEYESMEPAHIWYHTEEKEVFEVTMADLEALRFKYGERPYTGKQIRDVKGDRNG